MYNAQHMMHIMHSTWFILSAAQDAQAACVFRVYPRKPQHYSTSCLFSKAVNKNSIFHYIFRSKIYFDDRRKNAPEHRVTSFFVSICSAKFADYSFLSLLIFFCLKGRFLLVQAKISVQYLPNTACLSQHFCLNGRFLPVQAKIFVQYLPSAACLSQYFCLNGRFLLVQAKISVQQLLHATCLL